MRDSDGSVLFDHLGMSVTSVAMSVTASVDEHVTCRKEKKKEKKIAHLDSSHYCTFALFFFFYTDTETRGVDIHGTLLIYFASMT